MVGDLRKYSPLLLVAVAVLIAFVAMRGTSDLEPAVPEQSTDTGKSDAKPESPKPRTVAGKTYSELPPMTIDQNKHYSATFETSKGKIVCELFPKETPIAVNNFVFLARQGFYDGTVFHRVIKDFMIQGGDPAGTGAGGPGYFFKTEPSARKFTTGSLAMANAGPGTNGSQFFITHKPTPWLLGKHPIFGEVREGQDVVNAVAKGDVLNKVTIQEY